MATRRTSSTSQPTPKLTVEVAFGLVLREYRTSRGMTQLDLESESGVDRSFISQLENGRKQACLKTIIQIAYKLDISPGTLVDEVLQRLDKTELQKLL